MLLPLSDLGGEMNLDHLTETSVPCDELHDEDVDLQEVLSTAKNNGNAEVRFQGLENSVLIENCHCQEVDLKEPKCHQETQTEIFISFATKSLAQEATHK